MNSGMSYRDKPDASRCSRSAPGSTCMSPRVTTARQTRSPSRVSLTGNAAALLDRSVPLRQRFDVCRMDIAATADDQVLLAAGDMEIARLVDPAEIAGHKPSLRVKRRLSRLLVVEIAEHQAGAAAADLTDFAGCGLGIRIVLAPDADLVAGTGAPTGVDDALGRIVGQRVLVRASFRHAVAALRHDAVLHQLGDDRRRRRCTRDPKAAHGADRADATGSYLGEQIDRMRRHPEQKHGAGLPQPID